VSYTVAANTSPTERTGTITVGAETLTVTQAGAACTLTLTPSSVAVTAAASNGTINVATGTACAWTATSNVSWITVTSGTTGTGSGTVGYSVAANTASFSRFGALTIGGFNFTVSQAGTSCTSTLSSNSITIGAAASNVSVGLTTSADCAWTASSAASWVTVLTPSGTGPASVGLSVAANPTSGSRSASLTIAGKPFMLTQTGGCDYSITPTALSFNAAASSSSVIVATGSGCPWTAQSPVSWITLSAGGGTGGGTVNVAVAANTTAEPRSATISIADNAVVVTQAGATCNILVSPSSLNVVGGTQALAVDTPSGCTWSASSSVSWMTFPDGSSGSGSGNVSVALQPNDSGMSRIGWINLSGWKIFVNQRVGTPPSPPDGMRVVGQD
jgi:hypothetical protein